MTARRLHPVRQAAERHARGLANRAARPVLWGQHPLQSRGWLVEMLPSGYEGELVVLTLPDREARKRPTWPAQVLETYLLLQDLRERAAKERPDLETDKRFAELLSALLERTGFTLADMAAMTASPRPAGSAGRPRRSSLSPHTTPERSRVSVNFAEPEGAAPAG